MNPISMFPAMQMETTTQLITPARAVELLNHNKDNRPLSMDHARRLADLIVRGEWQLSPQGIALDENGNVLDGQHRLRAVMLANIPVWMRVTTGVPRSVFNVVDTTLRIRTNHDILGGDRRVVEVLNFVHRVVYGVGANKGNPTPAQIKQLPLLFKVRAEQLIQHASTPAVYLSSVPVKTAAVFSMLAQPKETQYIFDVYKNLVERKLGNLPPVAQALAGQVLGNRTHTGNLRGHTARLDAFARGMVVFDATKRDQSRIQIKDVQTYVLKARAIHEVISGIKVGAVQPEAPEQLPLAI